jgi:uncharacterized RDD family membrane protein YckC
MSETESTAPASDIAEQQLVSANPLRRIGAIVYDTLLVVAVMIVATIPFLPFLHGKVIVAKEVGAIAYLYNVWQIAIVFVFFGYFWTQKGRTLGMQAWRLRIVAEGGSVTWIDAVKRLAIAAVPWLPAFVVLSIADRASTRDPLRIIGMFLLAIGIGNYAIAWFDPLRRSWHDRFLRTRIVYRV